ncbi:MAG TPA: hypothetical protein VFE47_17450 [Tepidisphaeraceae bacterium]|jgi:uncharacterized membrane protein HdeD (DUF308 family)|nr:hypothetical protein [Tepidisphaeraceae bacterium]
MELNEALLQISEIHRHLARSEIFRGYRAATTAFSGVVALVACGIHAWLLPDSVDAFLWLWLGAAVLSLSVVGAEMVIRCRRSQSALQREMTMIAVEQFVPCMAAGGLLTYALLHSAWHTLWMLPGLWAILFGLGVFSSRRVLPRFTFIVGAWYLLSGVICIVTSQQKQSTPSPWEMALCFGVGQFLAASILYWNLERHHGEQG